MRKTEFTIDTFQGLKLTGFTDDDGYDGWACPYFMSDEAQKIVEAHNATGQKAWFDENDDQFVFEINDDTEFYQAVESSGQKLYPIGNGSWIWEEVEQKETAQ